MSFALRLVVVVLVAGVAQMALDTRPSSRAPAPQLHLADVGPPAATAVTEPVASIQAPVASEVARTRALDPAPPAAVDPVAVVAPVAAVVPVVSVEERRGAEALALVPFPVDRTGYRLVFEGHRDGYLGLTSTVNKTITIYIRSSQSTREIAKVIAHEVGHAIDVEFTTETERLLYRHIRGIDGRSWYPDCSGCTDYDSPAGDFAETFSMAMVGDVGFLSTVAAAPSATQLHALATIFTV